MSNDAASPIRVKEEDFLQVERGGLPVLPPPAWQMFACNSGGLDIKEAAMDLYMTEWERSVFSCCDSEYFPVFVFL